MAQIYQGDIFRMLNNRGLLNYSQEEICDRLNVIIRRSITPSRLSEIKKRKRKGYPDLAEKRDEVYEAFFAAWAREGELYLRKLIDYVRDNDLNFVDAGGRADDTYESYVKRMLSYGLSNYESQDIPQEKAGPYSAPQLPAPVLRCQHFPSTEKFIGRQEALDQISVLLRERHTAVLSGLGGIGKTYLSKEYAHQHCRDYTTIQCVLCRDTATSFFQMILELQFDHLDEQEWSDEEKFQRRMRYLKDADTTLLIFDNVDTQPEDMEVYEELIRDSRLHIIITTRTTDVFSDDVTIPIRPLALKEQLQLFELHLDAAVKEKDLPVVKEILEYIGGHTLLIELIAKSIDRGDISYEEMLDHLRGGMGFEMLPKVPVRKDGRAGQEELGHFVRKILFNIEPLPEDQRDTLCILSLLPADGISRRLFQKHLVPEHKTALWELESKGWVMKEKRDGDNITKLHPVIREVVKSELTPTCKKCRLFLEQLYAFLTAPEASDYAGDLCKLIPSVKDTIDFAAEPSEENLEYLRKMADFCRGMYRYRTALSLYQTALALWQNRGDQAFPGETPYELYTELGKLFQRLAQYSEAIVAFQTAIDYTQEKSEERARAYRNLGEVLRKNSQYEQALAYDQNALDIFQEPADIAEATNAIGVVYLNMGDAANCAEDRQNYYRLAKDYYERALELWQKCDAPARQLAFSNHNIGTVQHRLGEYAEAVKYHKAGLQIRRDNHLEETDIAASLVWLGKDHIALGQYDDAKAYIDQSLDIRKAILGENHPDYAWSLDSLSQWYEETGELNKAAETMERVITIRRDALGPDHQYTRQAVSRRDELCSKL